MELPEINDKMVNVTIEHYDGEKPIEVIVRKGEAAKAVDPLPKKAPIKVGISGVIATPADWLEKRVSEIDQKKAHVLVNRDKMTLTLIINEDDEYTKGEVKGSIAFTDTFIKTKINNEHEEWEPNKLGKFFRLNRALFDDKDEGKNLIEKLLNFTAKAKVEIQKQQDPNGSRADVFRQEVEGGLPNFKLKFAIFKGTPKETFEVEFTHFIQDGDCYLQLISPGANEVMYDYVDKCIDVELERIKGIAPDIAILEV